MIDRDGPITIFDDLSALLTECMKKESAAEIGKKFNRERKTVYAMRDGCGFHCDIDFLCGIRSLGYDIKLVKKNPTQTAESELSDSCVVSESLFRRLLSVLKEDVIMNSDIARMHTVFESAADDLYRIGQTLEILIPCLCSSENNSVSRDVLTLLWKNLSTVRDNMMAACSDPAVWRAAATAQTRIDKFEKSIPRRLRTF